MVGPGCGEVDEQKRSTLEMRDVMTATRLRSVWAFAVAAIGMVGLTIGAANAEIIGFEAESGTLGSEFDPAQADAGALGGSYITTETAGGGGGGAGYYGGGGGGGAADNFGAGGGGGGSSYTGAGTDVLNMVGSSTNAAYTGDAYYADNAGQGGTGGVSPSLGTAGNDGRIVILAIGAPGTVFTVR